MITEDLFFLEKIGAHLQNLLIAYNANILQVTERLYIISFNKQSLVRQLQAQ